METESHESYQVRPGDVVVVLPREVIRQVIRSAKKDHDPIAMQTAVNVIVKVLQDNWDKPEIRSLKDEQLYWDDRPNIRWGDIAVYAGPQRITTKAGHTRLGAKRQRRAKLHTARVMKPVFQFGLHRVIMDPADFIDVEHVPDKVFEAIREFRAVKEKG